MSGIRDLYAGLAELAATADASFAWTPGGVYPAGKVGIFTAYTPATPDRCITITIVPQGDLETEPVGSLMVQVKARGARNDPLDCDDLLDKVFRVFQGITNLPCGEYTIIRLGRRVQAPLGVDEQVRREAADQYYGDYDQPATVLRPVGGSW